MDEASLAEGDNTDEIIDAIRRIMKSDEEMLTGEAGTGTFSVQARERIFAALDRLTGGNENPPTVLEALMLEKLQDWLERNLPAMAERLMREEIKGLMRRTGAAEDKVENAAEANPTKRDAEEMTAAT